jgi:PhoPQ-activated pathogenicity-related protein
MNSSAKYLIAGLVMLSLAGRPQAAAAASSGRIERGARTALDRYVAAPDTNYAWHVVRSIPGDGYTVHVINLISQSWLTTNEVNRTLWQHWLTIVKPDAVTSPIGLLFIGGGSNRPEPPSSTDPNLIQTAVATKTMVAELRNVPNEPLTFAGEEKNRSEDALIAYTWDKFLRTGDARWPARLPMTKAAVRALDTMTAFAAGEKGGHTTVNRFFVAGGSKRGWTTWTTAAVDARVVAIAPIVIDMLNLVPSFIHHYKVYGFYAPAVGDYTRMKIMDWNGTPEYLALLRLVEPYQYRQRLTLPKFIINAADDQFFVPDSAQFYFRDLPGVKYLRYVPNADHSLRGSDAWQTLLAAYQAVVGKEALPRFDWTMPDQETFRVQTQTKPDKVKLWRATNPEARDFRLQTIKNPWTGSDLNAEGDGVYVARVEKPPRGWTAFFVELQFANGTPAPFKFTTEVRVVPDAEPFQYVQPTRPR